MLILRILRRLIIIVLNSRQNGQRTDFLVIDQDCFFRALLRVVMKKEQRLQRADRILNV